MDKLQALHSFWSGFGLTAYDENTVPDNAQMPYITYGASVDGFGNTLNHSASLWYYSNSWRDIALKEREIAEFISMGGKLVQYDDGAIWVQKSTPWAQRLSDPSNYTIRRVVLNLSIEFLSQ